MNRQELIPLLTRILRDAEGNEDLVVIANKLEAIAYLLLKVDDPMARVA